MRFSIFLLLIFSVFSWGKPKEDKNSISPSLKRDLSNLVEKAADFHKVLQDKNKKGLIAEIDDTQRIIKKLYGRVEEISYAQKRIHFHKVLKALENKLEAMRLQDHSYANQQTRRTKRLFKSFFEIALIYDLKNQSNNYVFYCHKDKGIWFQYNESKKPRNPINPIYRNCGRRVW